MKKILHIFLWVIILSGIVTTMAFVNKANKQAVVQKAFIHLGKTEENAFITEADILNLIQPGAQQFKAAASEKFPVHVLEKKIMQLPAVKDVQVYKNLNGTLHVDVEQRKPIVRVFNLSGESYYIDETGSLMPLSHNYTAHVLIVNGNLNDKYANRYHLSIADIAANDTLANISMLDDIYELAMFISKNAFWKAQIEHINVNKDFEFELYPRVGNHRIVFGDKNNMHEKFARLLIFYKKVLNEIGWNEYESINIKYNNQIVCTKRNV